LKYIFVSSKEVIVGICSIEKFFFFDSNEKLEERNAVELSMSTSKKIKKNIDKI
jgi:hypothetical protein